MGSWRGWRSRSVVWSCWFLVALGACATQQSTIPEVSTADPGLDRTTGTVAEQQTVADGHETGVVRASPAPPSIDESYAVGYLGRGSVHEIAWLPNDAGFVIATSRGLYVHSPVDGEPALISRVDKVPAVDLAVTPDGTKLVTVAGTALRLYDIASGDELHSVEAVEPLVQAEASDTHVVAATNSGRTFIVSMEGDAVFEVEAGSYPAADTFNSTFSGMRPPAAVDGNLGVAATGTIDGAIHLWSLDDGNQRAVFEPGSQQVTALDMGAGLLGAGSVGGQVSVWDVSSGRLVASVAVPELAISDVALSPDGSSVLLSGAYEDSAALASTYFWSLDSPEAQVLTQLGGRTSFSADGSIALVSSFERSQLLSLDSGRELASWSGQSGAVSNTVIAADSEERVFVIEPDGERERLAGYYGEPYRIDVHEETVAAAYADQVVIWDQVSGHIDETFDVVAKDVAFSADGTIVVTLGEDTVDRWRFESAQPIGDRGVGQSGDLAVVGGLADQRAYVAARGALLVASIDDDAGLTVIDTELRIDALAVPPDGSVVLLVGDGQASLLDPSKNVASPPFDLGYEWIGGDPDIAINAAGNAFTLVRTDDKTAEIRSLPNGELLASRPVEFPSSAAFSPVDDRVAVAFGLDTVTVFGPGSETDVVIDHWVSQIHDLAYNPAGDRLLGAGDGMITVWDP